MGIRSTSRDIVKHSPSGHKKKSVDIEVRMTLLQIGYTCWKKVKVFVNFMQLSQMPQARRDEDNVPVSFLGNDRWHKLSWEQRSNLCKYSSLIKFWNVHAWLLIFKSFHPIVQPTWWCLSNLLLWNSAGNVPIKRNLPQETFSFPSCPLFLWSQCFWACLEQT